MPTGVDLQPLMETCFAAADQRALDESDDAEGAELCSAPPSPAASQFELPPSEAAASGANDEAGQGSPCAAPAPSSSAQLEHATPHLKAVPPTPGSLPSAFDLLQQPLAAADHPAGRPSLPPSPYLPTGSGGPPPGRHLPSKPPDAEPAAPTSTKPADRRRKASQARKKAKRAKKAASGTGSFSYRVKASALPVLEGLASISAKVDLAKASVALPGAYVGKRSNTPAQECAPALKHLLKRGFAYHPWDGR